MRHSNSRSSADRLGNSMGRTVLEKVDDEKLMQETTQSLLGEEKQEKIELAHPYGFTSVPQAPTGNGKLRKAAEAFMLFMGAGRSHGVAIVAGDRRYRLYKLKGGEVALHDDQGMQVHLSRDGVFVSVPNSKKVVSQIMKDDKLPQDDSGGSGGSSGGGSSGSSGGSGQKSGQIAQAKRETIATHTMDKDSVTVCHPGIIDHQLIDANKTVLAFFKLNKDVFSVQHPKEINLKAPKIVADGVTHLGGTGGVPASKQGTVTTVTAGHNHSDIGNLATKVFVT